MTLKKFDSTFEENLEQTIAAIEEKTSVEVVAAISPSSDDYIDAYLKGGLILMSLSLLFLLYSPFIFSPWMIPLDLATTFFFGMIFVRLFPDLRRLLISRKRRDRCVDMAAHTFFMENHLDETTERTALLVYISVFEKKTKLIADKGIQQAIPISTWKEIANGFEDIFQGPGKWLPKRILDNLPTITEPFAQFLPPAEDNIDEISNRLRRVEL